MLDCGKRPLDVFLMPCLSSAIASLLDGYLSSLLSSLPLKQQELHQHPLQGRAQVSSQAFKDFLTLDGTFLSNYFFLYCLTQAQGTFVDPESSSKSVTETGVSTLLI